MRVVYTCMATTLTTYFYKGAFESDVEATFVCFNGHCYVTGYLDLIIFYGQYLGADQPAAIQPLRLPPLTDAQFTCYVYRANNSGEATSKYAVATLIASQNIYDIDNPHECLGTKFTFQSPCFEDCTINGRYCFVWSTNSNIQMSYGPDTIVIGGQSGTSGVWFPCD